MPKPENTKRSTMVLLHLLLMIFSINSIFAKLASAHPVGSIPFVLLYGASVCILALYAFGWQQIIKRMPLTTAYANRAVTIVWGLIWGVLLFQEKLTVSKVAGAALVLVGVSVYSRLDAMQKEE